MRSARGSTSEEQMRAHEVSLVMAKPKFSFWSEVLNQAEKMRVRSTVFQPVCSVMVWVISLEREGRVL